MAEVPLKIRVDIRDSWDSPKSAVQKAITDLEATLGHKVVPHVEWPALWDQLKDRYPDKATFVPTICRFAIAWYERLLWRLDSDLFPEWTEELLGLLSQAAKSGRLVLEIEPTAPPQNRPHTTWRASTKSFYLGIPKTDPPSHSSIVTAFDLDFENLLKAAPVVEEGWADVTSDAKASVTKAVAGPPPSTNAASTRTAEQPVIDRLPNVNTIAHPPELLVNTVPYSLIVDASSTPLTVQSSHQPSLELLQTYLTKWGKTNPNDSMRRPVLKAELIESAYFFGVSDMLTIEPSMNFRASGALNPTVVLAFIEGVLGYKLVHTTGFRWVYKSEVVLK